MPEHVLVCDDDHTICLVLSVCLRAAGYEVEAVASGAECLESAASHAPDLLVLDVMMPEMDGPAVLARLGAVPFPVVFLTGRDEAGDVERLKALGADAVLAKPFDPGSIHVRIGEVLERRRAAGAAHPGAEERA